MAQFATIFGYWYCLFHKCKWVCVAMLICGWWFPVKMYFVADRRTVKPMYKSVKMATKINRQKTHLPLHLPFLSGVIHVLNVYSFKCCNVCHFTTISWSKVAKCAVITATRIFIRFCLVEKHKNKRHRA